MKKIRIGIAHRHTMGCVGLGHVCEKDGAYIVSFTASNQSDLMNQLRLKKQDVLIFDLQWLDNYQQIIETIKEKFPALY